MRRTILSSEHYNALYDETGVLEVQGKPYALNTNTLALVFPDADMFFVPGRVYDEVLGGAGYPQKLSDFPLDRCDLIRRST